MRCFLSRLLAVLICLVLPGGLALGGEAGSISGLVVDRDGHVLASANVRVSGPLLPAGREALTSDGGDYWFQGLAPGEYRIEARTGGLVAQRDAHVTVDFDTRVDLVLAVFVESVAVVVEAPAVDMHATEVAFDYSAATIARLPLERSYRGLFQLVPGVADNRVDGADSFLGPSAGGSRQGNTFLIDGVNITNPGFGYLSTEVNELDIAELNVKRGAISAEFGRTAGLVTNAVTRSGTNDLAGSVRIEAMPRGLMATPRDPDVRNTTDRWVPAFGVGGPFVRDSLWWYASGRFVRSYTRDRSNSFGPLPDRVEHVNELFGKLTYQPTPRHTLSGSLRNRPRNVAATGLGANDSPAVATDSGGTSRVASGDWSFFPGAQALLDVKYTRLEEHNEDVAVTDLGFRPRPFDAANLACMGQFFDAASNANVGGAAVAFNRQNYTRDEIKAVYSRSLETGRTTHRFKAGITWEKTTEDLARRSNGWGSLSLVQGDTQIQATYYPLQPSQLSRSRTVGLFVQDAASIGQRLTLSAGVLVDDDTFGQQIGTPRTFLTFGFAEQVQPRLGVGYNLRAGRGDKLYANYGRYRGLDQKSSARSMAPLRLYQSDALFTRDGVLVSDTPRPSTTGKLIDRGLESPYVDEFVAGYATPLARAWTAEVFFLARRGASFIEDFPRTLPAGDYIYGNLENAVRRYRAVSLALERRGAGIWSLSASYTWSRFFGNYDLDNNSAGDATRTSAVFNTSSAIQDGPGAFVEDAGRMGPLSQDRPHVAKLFATLEPWQRISLGAFYRLQSGTPWAAKGRDYFNGFNQFLEPAGTRRNPTWHNVDLRIAWRQKLQRRTSLTLEARLLNVIGNQTVLFRDQRRYLDGRIRLAEAPYLVQGTTRPNPAFGLATEFAPSRRLLLSLLLHF